MQEQQQNKVKIHASLLDSIFKGEQKYNKNVHLTALSIEKNVYVLDLSIGESKEVPISLSPLIKIQQMKANETESQYDLCTFEQINKMTKKYVIFNLMISSLKQVEYKVIGLKLKFSENNKQQSIVADLKSLQKILVIMKDQVESIWKRHERDYCRNIDIKAKGRQKQNIIGLQPILQYQIEGLTIPTENNKRNIGEYEIIHQRYSLLFAIDDNLTEVAEKIKSFIVQKQKLQSKQNKQNKMVPFFNSPRCHPQKIFNPHLYAPIKRQQKFQLILCKGVYQYYHYGDQNFSDNGWGCAYRALQTLISWLNIQGHTTAPLASMWSIPQIQQKLDHFDRSRKLKNSNTWIGATQISWLIPTITKNSINCKILHVQDGKQILQKCQQLKQHLLTSGCPIMYGGGEYAYSIVGMHYNWKLGQCQFLILDPHYTGADEYGKLVEKKGVAWRKPEEMFKKGVFYNFCMPIVG